MGWRKCQWEPVVRTCFQPSFLRIWIINQLFICVFIHTTHQIVKANYIECHKRRGPKSRITHSRSHIAHPTSQFTPILQELLALPQPTPSFVQSQGLTPFLTREFFPLLQHSTTPTPLSLPTTPQQQSASYCFKSQYDTSPSSSIPFSPAPFSRAVAMIMAFFLRQSIYNLFPRFIGKSPWWYVGSKSYGQKRIYFVLYGIKYGHS